MELFDAGTLIFLIVFGFLSAFIDAVVGGGGLEVEAKLFPVGSTFFELCRDVERHRARDE